MKKKGPVDNKTNHEQKPIILHTEDEERWEKGRLKTLAARKGQPFNLSQLKMQPMDMDFASAPTAEQFTELAHHFGHSLPASFKEIFTHYNGGRPMLNYYGDDEDSSISHFYTIDEERSSAGNIWWAISTFSKYLGKETLPFAQDDYGGIYYLKWVRKTAQVWLYQYGDQPFDYEEETPTTCNFISDSLDTWLESLYAA